MPPFDESKFEPMPEVEINPKDDYWIDPNRVDRLILDEGGEPIAEGWPGRALRIEGIVSRDQTGNS
jgi:hypothetical protein